MPGRRAQPVVDTALCRRCQATPPVVTVRTEPLCAPCFRNYVSSKVVKRMESFRVRHADPDRPPRTLLLPLSHGAGSTALLEILTRHVRSQAERTGRKGFRLHVVHVEEPADSDDERRHAELQGEVERRFPEHRYSSASLEDFFANAELHVDGLVPARSGGRSSLADAMSSLDDSTSRADLLYILRRKLVGDFARRHDCEAILWGDSTTTLAERTIAQTAKGRGFSVPWIVASADSHHHSIPSHYPLQDLLARELAAFTTMTEPAVDNLVLPRDARQPVSARENTVDDLMRQYFDSVERDHPSIVANVVKTAGKLRPPALRDAMELCELCEMPLSGHAPPKSRLCHGCVRTLSNVRGERAGT